MLDTIPNDLDSSIGLHRTCTRHRPEGNLEYVAIANPE